MFRAWITCQHSARLSLAFEGLSSWGTVAIVAAVSKAQASARMGLGDLACLRVLHVGETPTQVSGDKPRIVARCGSRRVARLKLCLFSVFFTTETDMSSWRIPADPSRPSSRRLSDFKLARLARFAFKAPCHATPIVAFFFSRTEHFGGLCDAALIGSETPRQGPGEPLVAKGFA